MNLHWYQIKAESVLLTMTTVRTNFTQNVTCSLFCASASQIYAVTMRLKGILHP